MRPDARDGEAARGCGLLLYNSYIDKAVPEDAGREQEGEHS